MELNNLKENFIEGITIFNPNIVITLYETYCMPFSYGSPKQNGGYAAYPSFCSQQLFSSLI